MNTHKDKGEYPIYKSKCCGVGVSVSGIGITQYYVCNKCDKPCDFIPMTTSSKTNKKTLAEENPELTMELFNYKTNKQKKEIGERKNKFIAVHLSSYPTEEVMQLYIDKAERQKVKTLILSFPVVLGRYQAIITIK